MYLRNSHYILILCLNRLEYICVYKSTNSSKKVENLEFLKLWFCFDGYLVNEVILYFQREREREFVLCFKTSSVNFFFFFQKPNLEIIYLIERNIIMNHKLQEELCHQGWIRSKPKSPHQILPAQLNNGQLNRLIF